MSLLAIGLSHRSTPLHVLEDAALDAAGRTALAATVAAGENITEAVVLATCNRVEIYASALTFHGAVDEIAAAVEDATGLTRGVLNEHLYVHYEDRAVAHAFGVACGLDSMAVGEAQILGQMREALEFGQRDSTAGPELNALFQHSLRVGKRAHAETALDRAGASLVQEALLAAAEHVGDLAEVRLLVVGAGAMSALAATTAARGGVAELVVVNRTPATGARLAAGLGGRSRPWTELHDALAEADVVLTCTGSLSHVIEVSAAASAAAVRDAAGPSPALGLRRPQVYLDLALPRDVAPGVEDVPGVHVIGLGEIGARLDRRGQEPGDLTAVHDLVTAEVAQFLLTRRMQEVGPTVAALRSRAAEVARVELTRLSARRPDVDPALRRELEQTVHRVVEKLLHTPTVRVKELAGQGQGGDYAQALRELFDLDARDVATVSKPPRGVIP